MNSSSGIILKLYVNLNETSIRKQRPRIIPSWGIQKFSPALELIYTKIKYTAVMYD